MIRLSLCFFTWILTGSSLLMAQNPDSQSEMSRWQINRQLDSLVNCMPVLGKTAIIYKQGERVISDTLTISRYTLRKHRSYIILRCKGEPEKRIKETDLWGVVNEYGEPRRIRHGRSWLLSCTEAPYVYKVEGPLNIYYYFSETLFGELHLLNSDNIESIIQDDTAKKRLYNYMHYNNISGIGVDKKPAQEFLEAGADVLATVTINFTGIIVKSFIDSLWKSLD